MKKKIITALLLMVAIATSAQTISEVREEIKRQGLPCGEIVLAQARLETGNFTSRVSREKHNLFGIRQGRRYKSYRRWQDSVADYKRLISSRYHGGDYYLFLSRIRYAEDSRYIAKLKTFTR